MLCSYTFFFPSYCFLTSGDLLCYTVGRNKCNPGNHSIKISTCTFSHILAFAFDYHIYLSWLNIPEASGWLTSLTASSVRL